MANKEEVKFLTDLYNKYGDLPFDPVPEAEQTEEYKKNLTYALKMEYLKIFTEDDLDNVVGIKLQKGDQLIFSMRGREFVLTGGM